LGHGWPWRERIATCLSVRRVVRDCGDWTAKEEISRKKRKEKKKNTPEGKPVQVAWQCSPLLCY